MQDLLPPLAIPWTPKPVASATSGVEELADGRVRYWIRHDTLRGVTPVMLAWWFRNLDGDMEIGGMRVARYRAWHPLDHVQVRYARRRPDGSVGPGAVIHLTEYLGRNARFRVDVHTRIEKLDEEGFVHEPRHHGLRLARMEYAFERVPGGARYENALLIGPRSRLAPAFRHLVMPRVFPRDQGLAWIKHNVEEVGQLERFLPALYRAHTGLDA